MLFAGSPIGLWGFFRLRLMREGLNTLLPLAHVGGEVIAAQAMVQAGIPAPVAVAGMVVDVTVEVCAQLAFGVAPRGIELLDGATQAAQGRSRAYDLVRRLPLPSAPPPHSLSR